jgi:hypothetical protein
MITDVIAPSETRSKVALALRIIADQASDPSALKGLGKYIMKMLRITLQGKTYEVGVEVLDTASGSTVAAPAAPVAAPVAPVAVAGRRSTGRLPPLLPHPSPHLPLRLLRLPAVIRSPARCRERS